MILITLLYDLAGARQKKKGNCSEEESAYWIDHSCTLGLVGVLYIRDGDRDRSGRYAYKDPNQDTYDDDDSSTDTDIYSLAHIHISAYDIV